ncbi:MAG: NPCBM/NEW2 domain-containing protein [Planctomycetota bacterium]|nr:NPCBM/NEW2 domain-containing protein [Planctomycetota bacterium]
MSLTLATTLILLPACQAGEPAPVTAPVSARWIESEGVREGEWLGWSESGPRRAGPPVHGPWLALEFAVAAQPPDDEAWVMELAGGGRLRGEPGPDLPDAGMPTWRLALRGSPLLPFDSLWFRGQGRGSAPPPDPRAEQDRLWLRRPNGVLDLQRGWLLDWRAAGPVFETAAGERTAAWQEVDSLRVLADEMEVAEDAVWLFLADGSALLAKVIAQDPRADQGAWQIELPWGVRARLPADAVTRVRRREGVEEWAQVEWLVREQPGSAEVDWSPKLQRSVEGHALRLGERTWPDGIGVKAPSELARSVPGPGTLLLTVGADARVVQYRQPQAVVFRVLLDEQELLVTAPLSSEGEPQTLLVRVPRAGLLRLRAETVGAATHGAHGDWCDLLWLGQR